MKRLFQTITLLGTLVLGQQAAAQDSRQKDYLHIQRFSREKAVQRISYQDNGKQYLKYSPRINPYSGNELGDFIRNAPLLGTFYEMSNDKEPVKLYDGRIEITFSASRGNSSVINGLIRRFVKLLKE